MSDGRRRAGFLTNRAVVLLTTALVAIGLTGLSTTAMAGDGNGNGNGNGNGGHKKHKKKKCPKGTHKVVTFKHGKKKKKCVADPIPPAPPATPGAAALVITPNAFTFPATQHGGFPCTGTGNHCNTQAFTVTNAGKSASGVPVASITEVHNPETGSPPAAFQISPNGCTAALAPAATCTLTVQFAPNSNAGDQEFSSVLHVIASPGGDAQAQLAGHAD
jgi:hypothetical protein